MIGALTVVGVIALSFGILTERALGQSSLFVTFHLVIGGLCLAGAAVVGLMRIGRTRQPALRAPLLRALLGLILALAGAFGVYGAAAWLDLRFDWTFEGQFELAEATESILNALPEPLALTLYSDTGDPRIRNTRLLLEEMARNGDVTVRVREIEEHPSDEERYGLGSSNSVVVSLGDAWTLVERPNEGTLYSAISGLVRQERRIIYVTVGAGEGNLEKSDDGGYSGLHIALESEGYAPRPLPLALAAEIPPDAAAILTLAPRRRMPARALSALQSYVEAGGRWIAFVEPNVDSGIESVLTHFGITPEPGFVIDPSSGPIEGDPPGYNPVTSAYSQHPVTQGLDSNRMTFFRGARALSLRKAQPNDRLRSVVHTSGEAWIDLAPDRNIFSMDLPTPPPGVRGNYQTLVAVGEIKRDGPPARIVVFGDADIASNRSLTALYNLDLVMNAIHWATEEESAISIRPKAGGRQLIQFPVPLQTSLQAFYGVGLLVPECLLILGGLVWLRQREA
ncbi:MAG: Gldg family protein [Myxococcota bacterium]|nr:Gldg family protein [Myxococcota bacterium]